MERLGRTLSVALLIDVPDDEVVRRLGGRRTCVEQGHVFHIEFDPPAEEGVCDVCGGELIVREDDRDDVIRNRLEQYHEKTEPLVVYYEGKGILRKVDGARGLDEVAEEIRGELAIARAEGEV
jgi:adenylate kinase